MSNVSHRVWNHQGTCHSTAKPKRTILNACNGVGLSLVGHFRRKNDVTRRFVIPLPKILCHITVRSGMCQCHLVIDRIYDSIIQGLSCFALGAEIITVPRRIQVPRLKLSVTCRRHHHQAAKHHEFLCRFHCRMFLMIISPFSRNPNRE